MDNHLQTSCDKFEKKKVKSRKWKTKASLISHWMFFDSGASRTVIQTESPLRSHLSNVIPSHGSCTIGNGTKLPYVETGTLTANNQATVIEGLEFDLYSAVAAAKRGISAVIDFDSISGENRSFTYCKDSGEISPLVERRHGALEVPVHLLLSRQDTVGLIAKDHQGHGKSFCIPQPLESKLHRAPVTDISSQYRPFEISAFCNSFDSINLSLESRQDNTTELSLFTFDVVHSLNQRDKDFLLHARLAHLPSKKIL
jgi:hypothetical protein